jgi:RNA polymerase sigma-70 factor (family 1)
VPNLSDEQREVDLLRRFHEGDANAFEEIFNTHWSRLYRIALKGLKSHEEAEELVQELFANIWQQKNNLRILNLSSYLNSAIRKRVIDSIRSRLVHDKYWNYYQHFMPGFRQSTEETLAFDELNRELELAIKRLPGKSQQVFRLNRLEGHPVSEIAKFLKISERAIEYHLTKSIRQLRNQLKDFILFFILAFFL